MTWFSYLKSEATSLSYPYVKRYISKFTPNDTIQEGSWLFLDVSSYDIDIHYNNLLVPVSDPSSYLVTYENPLLETEAIVPTKSVIYNGILYFQTVEDHNANEEIANQYAIYYRTPNIRYVYGTTINDETTYEVGLAASAPYKADFEDVDLTSFTVDLQTSSYYGFSFINMNSDWDNGLAKTTNSKVYINFSGPAFELYGTKGPDHGRFTIKISSYADETTPISSLELENFTVDCFSSSSQQNQLLFSKNNLPTKECILELQVISDKNTLSSGNKVQISSFQFSYNTYITLENESLFDQTPFIIRDQYSSSGQAVSYPTIQYIGSSGGSSSNYVGDAAPSTANQGDIWFDTSIGKAFIYYDGYWVQI